MKDSVFHFDDAYADLVIPAETTVETLIKNIRKSADQNCVEVCGWISNLEGLPQALETQIGNVVGPHFIKWSVDNLMSTVPGIQQFIGENDF